MNNTILTVDGYSYNISNTLATDEALVGDYVLCLDEVRDNALPKNRNNQVPFVYPWNVGNHCYGCRKILETNDPKLVQKGIKKLKTTS